LNKDFLTHMSIFHKIALAFLLFGGAFSFTNHHSALHTCGFKVPIHNEISSCKSTILYNYDSIFYFNPGYLTYSFDFPVGKPNGKNYYLASRFGQRNHLGEDWNGKGGGNTDLGDPVYSIGNGLVTKAEEICCGWGNVVRVVHKLEGHPEFKYLESVYAHLDEINVVEGQLLTKGQNLGTIGTANGKYLAHLHLELRDFLDMSMGPGYSEDWEGYLDPSYFIRNNRHF